MGRWTVSGALRLKYCAYILEIWNTISCHIADMPLGGYIGMRYIVSLKLPKIVNFLFFPFPDHNFQTVVLLCMKLSHECIKYTQYVPSKGLVLFVLTKTDIFATKKKKFCKLYFSLIQSIFMLSSKKFS